MLFVTIQNRVSKKVLVVYVLNSKIFNIHITQHTTHRHQCWSLIYIHHPRRTNYHLSPNINSHQLTETININFGWLLVLLCFPQHLHLHITAGTYLLMSRGDLGIPDYRLIRSLSALYKILAYAFEFHMAQCVCVTNGSNIQSSNQQFFFHL